MSVFDEDVPVIVPNWGREFWVSDPGPFTDIAFDLGIQNFLFRAQFHEMPNIRSDFTKFIDVFSRGRPWNVIWTPYPGNWAVLFTHEHGWRNPQACWSIWRASEHPLAELKRLFEVDIAPGTVMGRWGTVSGQHAVPVATVAGQEHRVLVANMPQAEQSWVQVVQFAQQLQATNPERTLHYHGQKSVGRTIGTAAKSFDHPVRLGWDDGYPRILLPNGMIWHFRQEPSPFQKQWLKIVGVSPKDFNDLDRKALGRKVYEVNLRSLRWAHLNWHRAWDFRRPVDDEDLESSEMDWSPKTLPIRLRKTQTERMELDRWLCDTCSLNLKCPYSREGAVCVIPDSGPADLAANFRTRNAALIVESLGNILAANTQRAQRALRQEQEVIEHLDADPEGKPQVVLSPELTKLMDSLFKQGTQLAKLVDPAIAKQMSPGGMNLNLNLTAGTPGTSQALMGYIAAELEARGVKMEDATDELIQEILAAAAPRPQAIEATTREF